jgi:hypothetical protein
VHGALPAGEVTREALGLDDRHGGNPPSGCAARYK